MKTASCKLSITSKMWRGLISPSAPLSDEVWLCVVSETATGAVLGSDYAEHKVNERAFRRLGHGRASMLVADAKECGLEDGWT